MAPDVAAYKRYRAVIIEVLYSRHSAQQHRADHVMMWTIMQNLGCDLGENEVLTL